MSWFRKVKSLSDITYCLFAYIMWIFLNQAFMWMYQDESFKINELSIIILFVFITAIFICEKLRSIYSNKKKLILVISIVLTEIPSVLMEGNQRICYVLFSIFFILIFLNIDDNFLSQESYKNKIYVAFFILVIISVLSTALSGSMASMVIRFVILFAVMSVLLLRNVRNYSCNIKNKKDKFIDIATICLFIIFSVEKVYKIVIFMINIILSIISNIIYFISMFIINYILAPLFGKIFYNLKDIQVKMPERQDEKVIFDSNVTEKIKESKGILNPNIPSYVYLIINIVIILFVIWILYRFYKKSVTSKVYEDEDLVEETRERIKNKKSSKNRYFSKLKMKLFSSNDVRSKITHVFLKFQQITYNKGIFKRFMTAKQLTNVTRAYVDSSDELKKIAEIYNEAKFSKHNLENNKYEEIKNCYEKVKKQL